MTGTGTAQDPYVVNDWDEFVTAIGTNQAYVEFPKQLVLTSDTTVQQGKMYVDDNGELIIDPKNSEISSYYENTFVIDFNDYYPYGYGLTSNNRIQIRAVSINGKGGMIKNLNVYSDSSYGTEKFFAYYQYEGLGLSITNLSFANIICENCDLIGNNYSGPYGNKVKSCHFSGSITADTANSRGASLINFSDRYGSGLFAGAVSCGFNIELHGKANWCKTDAPHNSRYSRFEITGDTTATILMKGKHNYIIGELDNSSIEISADEERSIYDINVDSITGTNTAHTLANSDKCSDISEGITAVTTEQLQDAEYLRSIEFLIQL